MPLSYFKKLKHKITSFVSYDELFYKCKECNAYFVETDDDGIFYTFDEYYFEGKGGTLNFYFKLSDRLGNFKYDIEKYNILKCSELCICDIIC